MKRKDGYEPVMEWLRCERCGRDSKMNETWTLRSGKILCTPCEYEWRWWYWLSRNVFPKVTIDNLLSLRQT